MLFGRRDRKAIRLLIVEDEPLIAFDTEHFLSDCGYIVVATVDHADDARAAIAGGGIDLVLSDVTLSRASSGRDVALAAKAAGVPLLFVTSRCPEDAPQISIGCLAKPYKQRDLSIALEAIEALLDGVAVPKRLPKGLTFY